MLANRWLETAVLKGSLRLLEATVWGDRLGGETPGGATGRAHFMKVAKTSSLKVPVVAGNPGRRLRSTQRERSVAS
jgi:hypothetical protein